MRDTNVQIFYSVASALLAPFAKSIVSSKPVDSTSLLNAYIGWKGNVQMRTSGVTAAPVVNGGMSR